MWHQVPVDGDWFEGDSARIYTWCVAAFICLYVVIPFAQIFQRDGRLTFPYRDLSFHAWTNVFIAALGLRYAAVYAVLILLWGGLFALIGIPFFWSVFTSTWFVSLTCPTVFGYGLATGRENARFPNAGRSAALAVFRFLMPMLAGIEILFPSALPFTGLTALWRTGFASALLLGLSGLVVLFANAVFEDGEVSPPPGLRRFTEAAVAALPIPVAIAGYALWLRVGQYGLSPGRIYAIVICAITGLFALSYAAALFGRRDPWFGGIRRINVVLSLVVVAIGFALHTPLLDPLRWSAHNQVSRLLSRRVSIDDFDFASLRFHLGRPGDRALDQLAAATDHPEHEAIARAVRSAREQTRYAHIEGLGPDHLEPLGDDDLILLGSLSAAPEGLTTFIGTDHRLRGNCYPGRACGLFAVDLDADGAPEHCLVTALPTTCFTRSRAGWRRVGALTTPGGGQPDVDAILSNDAEPEPVAPRYRDVRIGEQVFRVVP